MKIFCKVYKYIVRKKDEILNFLYERKKYSIALLLAVTVLVNFSMLKIGERFTNILGGTLVCTSIVTQYDRDLEHGSSVYWIEEVLTDETTDNTVRGIIKAFIAKDKEELSMLQNRMNIEINVLEVALASTMILFSILLLLDIVLIMKTLLEFVLRRSREPKTYKEGGGI